MCGLTLTDEELVRAFRAGEADALEELIVRYIRPVRALVYPMVLNNADADDLTQEILIRAVRGLPQFREEARFSTWLHVTALNAVRSFLRRRDALPVCATIPPDCEDLRCTAPDDVAAAGELDREIHAAMRLLSPPLRAGIVLTVFRGKSVQDAAALEGCSAATMYWRVHKARKLLKKQLAKYLE